MRRIDEIIVHCSATKAGLDIRAKDIDLWHRRKGWKGIGYHYVIDLDGTVERGRDDSAVGAHCLGHNSHSIGVCYIGGYDAHGRPCDTRTDAQKDSMWSLLFLLHQQYPNAKIHGHRDFAKKDCPCFDAAEEYKPIFEDWPLLYKEGEIIPMRPSRIEK